MDMSYISPAASRPSLGKCCADPAAAFLAPWVSWYLEQGRLIYTIVSSLRPLDWFFQSLLMQKHELCSHDMGYGSKIWVLCQSWVIYDAISGAWVMGNMFFSEVLDGTKSLKIEHVWGRVWMCNTSWIPYSTNFKPEVKFIIFIPKLSNLAKQLQTFNKIDAVQYEVGRNPMNVRTSGACRWGFPQVLLWKASSNDSLQLRR